MFQSLRGQVWLGASVATLALVALPTAYAWTAAAQRDTIGLVVHTDEVLREIEAVRGAIREAQLYELSLVATADPSYRPRLAEASGKLRRLVDELAMMVADNVAQSARVATLRDAVGRWLGSAPSLPTGVPSPPADRDRVARGEHADGSARELVAVLNRVGESEIILLRERTERSYRVAAQSVLIVALGSAVAIAAVVILAMWLNRSLTSPIRELTVAAAEIERGALDTRVAPSRTDELARLGGAFNRMADSLRANAAELAKRDVQAGVLEVAEVLATSADLATMLDATLERILQVVHCPGGAIYVVAPGEGTLSVLAASGVGPEVADQVVRPGEGLVGRVARSRVATFAQGEGDPSPLTIDHWHARQRPAQVAYLPLLAGPELVGVLALAGPAPFDERTRNLLRIVAGQLGFALQNAIARQTLVRQAAELESRNARLAAQQGEIERQNRELRLSSQLKSEFLANMSHELRTPLTIILGFTNTVQRGTQGPLNPEQADSLRRVYDNARQLLNLINDILDLSKIEAGQMEVDEQPIALAPFLGSTVDSFQGLARTKGLELKLELEPGLPPEVRTDEIRLRQVVVNLVSNALKFTDAGDVTLRARPDGPGHVELTVRDTGPGIAEADVPKIFEQFRQLDGRTTRRAGGTGLGLSIVAKLVEMLGGTIQVRSTLGEGSTFLVRLPVLAPGTKSTPVLSRGAAHLDAPQAAPRRPGRLVLAIDDDEDFHALLRGSLAGTSLRLQSAVSGREGLELARRLRPDAITLDVMMPEMDGWTVLAALKADPSTSTIPVILLTVLQRRGLGLMLGAADYLTKPLDRDHLLRALRGLRPAASLGPILIVDDDPDIREMLSIELRAAGFGEVLTAADGVEGLRLARDRRPSLVILDLMMPDLDGFEVAARLQADESTRDVPILILTAKDLTAEDLARLNDGIEDVIQKEDQTTDVLIQRLVKILDGLGVTAEVSGE